MPEPNTWREVLATIDARLAGGQSDVAVQEYGMPNVSLVAGLEARGAKVEIVQGLSLGPAGGHRAAGGERRATRGGRDRRGDVHVGAAGGAICCGWRERMNLDARAARRARRMVVASVGPTTSEMLARNWSCRSTSSRSIRRWGISCRRRPQRARRVAERKRQSSAIESLSRDPRPAERTSRGAVDGRQSPAWSRQPVHAGLPPRADGPYTPVWLMRQAGRYMAEYRAVREQTTFLELCKNPQLCSEVMCTAVKRLGVDAAIIFSDLLPILEPMGLDLEFAPGEGPVIHNPVREPADVDRVVELESVESLALRVRDGRANARAICRRTFR